MNKLPNDYTRCATVGCPLEGNCLRKSIPEGDSWYTLFIGGINCEHYIEDESKRTITTINTTTNATQHMDEN